MDFSGGAGVLTCALQLLDPSPINLVWFELKCSLLSDSADTVLTMSPVVRRDDNAGSHAAGICALPA